MTIITPKHTVAMRCGQRSVEFGCMRWSRKHGVIGCKLCTGTRKGQTVTLSCPHPHRFGDTDVANQACRKR